MEAARGTVKKILGNESGNLLVIISLIGLMTMSLVYFTRLSDMVDQEIVSLSSTQNSIYLKPDLQETIKRSIKGMNDECPVNVLNDLRAKFLDFGLPTSNAIYTYKPGDIDLKSDKTATCFFHPGRYGNAVKFENVYINLYRDGEPNLINLSSTIAGDVRIGVNWGGKKSVLKFIIRYRVDVLSLDHFGMIFNSPRNGKLIDQEDSSSQISFNTTTLVDMQDRNRNDSFDLSLLIPLKRFDSVYFNEDVYIAAPSLTSSEKIITFLKDHKISDIMKKGMQFGILPTDNFISPYQSPTNQYRDLFNYDVTASGRYLLPKLDASEAVIGTSASGITHQYSRNKFNEPLPGSIESFNKSTAAVYELMSGDKKRLNDSCNTVDLSSGVYNLFIFNNLNEDFTIDFSGNTELSDPPVFCGLIAAKNLTIILNGDASGPTMENHFIGKIILNGKLTVKNAGKLTINDIVTLTQDSVQYDKIDDVTNLTLQYMNQKYYSTQNFALPFMKNNIYSGKTDLLGSPDQYWVPRDVRNFFNKDCFGKKCRMSPITSPSSIMDIITRNKGNLLYEAFVAE